jgi:hypothetical protein
MEIEVPDNFVEKHLINKITPIKNDEKCSLKYFYRISEND